MVLAKNVTTCTTRSLLLSLSQAKTERLITSGSLQQLGLTALSPVQEAVSCSSLPLEAGKRNR